VEPRIGGNKPILTVIDASPGVSGAAVADELAARAVGADEGEFDGNPFLEL
jgi:hypothetical protein